MKANDKKRKYILLTLKNLIIGSIFIISIFYMIIFYYYYFGKNTVYAMETSINIEDVKISNAQKINIDTYIEQNVKQNQKEEYKIQEVELEYITKYRNNSELPSGVVQVVQEGREGKQEIQTKIVYQNEEIISEEQISAKVTKASIDKIVEIGTGTKRIIYDAKVGDTVYVTSDRLSVMFEPNENSEKLATLTKNDEITILNIQEQWYYIRKGNITGYVKKDATSSKNYNEEKTENNTIQQESQNTQEKNKSELVSTVSFDMELNKPSGLTLEQFEKVLTDSKDKNNVFKENAKYFYYIESQYNINGIFVASVGIHESAWGTSQISKDKFNLFGYGAYDSNPYNGAYTFTNYSESIDLLARVFVKYYLNKNGTPIYNGETAKGTYYNGPTLTGVNTKYATDKNWANAVYTHIKYLYNKL